MKMDGYQCMPLAAHCLVADREQYPLSIRCDGDALRLIELRIDTRTVCRPLARSSQCCHAASGSVDASNAVAVLIGDHSKGRVARSNADTGRSVELRGVQE